METDLDDEALKCDDALSKEWIEAIEAIEEQFKNDVLSVSTLEKFKQSFKGVKSYKKDEFPTGAIVPVEERASIVRQQTQRRLSLTAQSTSNEVYVTINVYSFTYINSFVFNVIGETVVSKCIDKDEYYNSTSSSGLVVDTLFEQCDCVPTWLEQEVYFGPVATLFLSIVAVVAFLFINRLKPYFIPALKKLFHWITCYKFIGSSSSSFLLRQFLKLYHQLPEAEQIELMVELRRRFGESWQIPDIGIPPSTTVSSDLSHLASIEFLFSFNDYYKLNQNAVETTIESILFERMETLFEKTDIMDSTVAFTFQLFTGLYVLFDYFLIQEWPSGSSWQCRWAYFTAVVMYKPFSIPMWFCITLCCQYGFADQTYDKKRDETTGTPYGAPVERSQFTMTLMFITTTLQGVWFSIAAPVVLPLLLSFAPVVTLPSFFLPLVLIIVTQAVLTEVNTMIEIDSSISRHSSLSSQHNENDIEMVTDSSIVEPQNTSQSMDELSNRSLKPTLFIESVFALKAAAAQLISVFVIAFKLLPFYENGFSWWQQGVNISLLYTFDWPQIQLEFSYSFTWPHFHQPRIGFQLAFGVLVVGLQFASRIVKRFLFTFASSLQCEFNQPHYFEKWFLNLFSKFTWYPFRKSTEVIQSVLPIWRKEMMVGPVKHLKYIDEYYEEHDYHPLSTEFHPLTNHLYHFMFWLFIWLVPFIRFIYLMFTIQTIIKFNVGEKNKLLALINSEDILAYTVIIVPNFDDEYSFDLMAFIQLKCPWIVVENEEGNTPVYMAAMKGYDNIVKMLIDANCNVNIAEKMDGKTPVYMAAFKNHENIAKMLIDAHCDVNIANRDGMTPLYMAAWNGHENIVKMLIDANCNVKIAEKMEGNTPVYMAAWMGHENIVKMLIDANCDVDIAEKEGRTPVFIAAWKGDESIVKMLIDANCNVNIVKGGRTPLDIARAEGHTACVKLLEAAGAKSGKD